MVDRSVLKQKIKEKILLQGESGSGKTYLAVRIAEVVASTGRQVVFIDPEYGAERELELLPDEVLKNIELRITPDWRTFREAVSKDDACFVKIVDGLSEGFLLSKRYLEERYVASGYYIVSDKKVEVKDRETFTLPWEGYPKVYDGIRGLTMDLIEGPYHFVCTMHPLVGEKSSHSKKELEESIYRKFDTILGLSKVTDATGAPKWVAEIKKHRGTPMAGTVILAEHVEALKKLFKKRMEGG